MKIKFYTLLFLLFGSINWANAQENNPAWQDKARKYAIDMEYDFYSVNNGVFTATNNNNHIRASINSLGYAIYSLQTNYEKNRLVDFHLKTISRNSVAYSFKEANSNKTAFGLVYRSSLVDVEYANNEKGLRQNFILKKKIAGNGPVKINIQVTSNLSVQLVNQEKLVIHSTINKNGTFSYDDLKVWDADHKMLSSKMEYDATSGILSLVVDDKGATYPVTVDPLNQTSEWATSADGILPGLLTSLPLQVTTLYGYSVIGLGDINNDGYDDAAISAPGMANVVAGSGTLLNVGAVFIYLGSPSGLSATPAKILQPNITVAGALFGLSMDAGDVTGDGKPDLIISAPMDTYQTTAAGLLGDVNVNVTAGKVYVYRSEDLFSAPNPSPFLQLCLQGHDFFSTGVLGLLNNITTKALFGFSVAVTDDLNGDGKKDIVIGAPAYLGTNLLSIQSGAAFVYYSNNLSTLSPQQLNVPTPSILGLITLPLANLNGLLYGFSIDGCGDYNNDGHPDIVVSSPAGIDLSSLGGIFSGQVLGGSAYVYYSNGTSINSNIGATLQGPSGTLLGNAANLFGYKVKGVRDAAGNRNGNILISATSANILSNITSGLKLKAGQLNVFVRKTTAFTSPVTPTQSLSSPRSSSVLSLLAGQTLNVSLLYGASIDNTRDLNCDNIGDIIVGEPLSTNVPVIGANITGGAAYIYTGKADGTYSATPIWSLYPQVSPLLGVNATSLLGFSVAGAGHVYGAGQKLRVITGGPTSTLDFGSGLMNIGNTVSTLMNFTFDNNGLGKAYSFNPDLCGLTTLPVSLIQFNGYAVDKTVQLTWKSQNEQNLDYYELQRGTDGSYFETISMVFAKEAAANDYAYPDKHPFAGTNYYRLKMVDNDLKYSYSNIISARFTEKLPGTVNVVPNPVRTEFNVLMEGMEKGVYQLRLYNNVGQLMQSKAVNVTDYRQTIPMNPASHLEKGIYWLNIYDNTGKKVNDIKVAVLMD
jgi:hypothetical protein